MFKIILTPLCLFAVTTSVAQITITNSDMPNSGDSVRVSTTMTTGGINHTLSGPGYAWDFSTLTPDAQRFDVFMSPTTFPIPYNFLFNPLNTSYGQVNYQNAVTIFPGFSIDGDYDFFKEGSATFRQIGIGYILTGIPVPMLYSKPDTIYDFPVNYLDTMNCDFKFATPAIAAVPFYYGEHGHRTSIVDGWGDLILPSGTFPTLRVRSVITSIDTIYLDTLSFGTNIPRPDRYEYKWLGAGKKVPLLEIDATDIGGTETITSITYQDTLHPEVPQVGIHENINATAFSVYPNPASDHAFVNYTLNAASKVRITLTNMIGQTIAVIADGSAAAGKQTSMINVKELNAGIYFVTLQSGNEISVKKLVVGK